MNTGESFGIYRVQPGSISRKPPSKEQKDMALNNQMQIKYPLMKIECFQRNKVLSYTSNYFLRMKDINCHNGDSTFYVVR